MEHPLDSSPPIPDPSSAPFPSYPMPMPVVNVQMPSADAPYGQLYASEDPYASEPPYASEQPYAPGHLYPFQQSQQPYHAPPQASVSLDHTELPPEPWVPKVPGQSDEEVFPTPEPVFIPTPEHVQTGASVSRKPSRLRRLASFLGIRK